MISKDLKELIDAAGGRYIIVENGRPRYIVLEFEDYKRVFFDQRDQKLVQLLTEEELVDRINADIALWRESQKRERENGEILPDEIEELKDIEYI